MNKLTTVFILISFGLINGLTYEQKQFAQILPMNFSKYRHVITKEELIQPVMSPYEKVHVYHSYCIIFEIIKNQECLSIDKKQVTVLCEKPAMNKDGECNGEGLYKINTTFLSLENKCFGT